MYNRMHYFKDLDTVIDDVHGLFDQWEAQHQDETSFPLDTLMVAKLAIHEWIANLKRHARFLTPRPKIGLCISPSGKGIACVVEDNSEGFDLSGYYTKHKGISTVLPERGMGLHMIKAFTANLDYRSMENGGQQLAFFVPIDHNPCLDIPLP